MAGHWTDSFSFVAAAVRDKTCIFVVLSDDAVAQKKNTHVWHSSMGTRWLGGRRSDSMANCRRGNDKASAYTDDSNRRIRCSIADRKR